MGVTNKFNAKDALKKYQVPCIVVGFLALVGAVAWLAYRIENISDRHAALVASLEADKLAQDISEFSSGGWETRVMSANGAFAMTLPDGWGSMIKPKGTDMLLKMGTKQPDLGKGNKVWVTETDGYGGDSPTLFSAVLLEKGGAAPSRGTATDFAIGKSEDEIKGHKYSYVYETDELEGIGKLRMRGDRDYEYVLPLNGKELHIYYHVYGSDPRNLVETIDEMVYSIAYGK